MTTTEMEVKTGKAAGDAPSGKQVLEATNALVRREIRTTVALGFFINLLVLSSPIYMMQVFDRVLPTGHVETLVYLTLIVFFALAVYGALETLRSRALARVAFAMEGAIRAPALRAWLQSSRDTGLAKRSPLVDLQAVRSFAQGSGPTAFCDAPWVPMFLAILWMLHPLLGVIGIVSALVLVVMAVLNEFASRKSVRQAQTDRAVANEIAHSAASGGDSVVAMGMFDRVVDRHDSAADAAIRHELGGIDRSAGIVGMTKALRVAVQVIILGAGGWLVLNNELTSGGMIAASIILGRALSPAEQAIGAWRSFVPVRDSWRRLKATVAEVPARGVHVELPVPQGRLSVEDVTFLPGPGRPPILEEVRFTLDPGDVCAVVGPSGAGKSTLCRIVVGALRPTSGAVRLDEADMHVWAESERGRHVGYLPQDVDVFYGTVAENIARLEVPESMAVVAAAETSGIHSLVLRMPEGYATRLGSGGVRLSGGQRQRVGLARALFGHPRLVVLDEPNASLDRDGERALTTAIQKLKSEGVTVLMVVHQAQYVGLADKILLMREGRVQLFGPRDDVLRTINEQRKVVVPMPGVRTDPRVAASGGPANGAIE